MNLKVETSLWSLAIFLSFVSLREVRGDLPSNPIGTLSASAATSEGNKAPMHLLKRSYNSGLPVILHDKAPEKVPSKAHEEVKASESDLVKSATSSKSSKRNQKKRIAKAVYDSKTHKTKEPEAELTYVPTFHVINAATLYPKEEKKNKASSSTSAETSQQ